MFKLIYLTIINVVVIALLTCSHAFGSFESSFRNYNYSFPNQLNPMIGALWIESDFLLKVYLYGNERNSFVKCVKGLFRMSKPNTTNSSDFKVVKKILLDDLLKHVLAEIPSEKLFPEFLSCSEDYDILWAAFYLSNKRNIPTEAFLKIRQKVNQFSLDRIEPNAIISAALDQSFWDDLILFVGNHHEIFVPQESMQTESVALEMLIYGIYSNPRLKERLNSNPHWPKLKENQKAFFQYINQPDLEHASEQELKEEFAYILQQISLNIEPMINWNKVIRDIPNIAYKSFHILNSGISCSRKRANQLFVKVNQDLYDSLEGDIVFIKDAPKECSRVQFKKLSNNEIYFSVDDGIVLYGMDASLRNYEAILSYFFGVSMKHNFGFNHNPNSHESFVEFLKYK